MTLKNADLCENVVHAYGSKKSLRNCIWKLVSKFLLTLNNILKIGEELRFPDVEVQVADVTVVAEVNVVDRKPNVVDFEVGGFSCHMTVARKLLD